MLSVQIKMYTQPYIKMYVYTHAHTHIHPRTHIFPCAYNEVIEEMD